MKSGVQKRKREVLIKKLLVLPTYISNKKEANLNKPSISGFCALIFGVGAILTPFGAWTYAYRSSSETIKFTVDQRERVTQSFGDHVKSYYLVWSREGEVFQVTDDLLFLTWNSSDRYGQLKEGKTVTVKVAGWRVPLLSWYRNVIEVQPMN